MGRPDGRTADGTGKESGADMAQGSDVLLPDLGILDAAAPDLVSPPNSIGPGGGVAKSADGKCELLLPAGALAKAVTFNLTTASSAPGGAIGTACDIGPASTKLLKPALVRLAFDKTQLAGALEWSLKLGRSLGTAWARLPSSFMDPVADKVSGLTPSLGTFAVLSGGAQADVAKVVAVPPSPGDATGLWLGAPGGSAPLLSAALDSQDRVLKGAVLTYSSANPQRLAVDSISGMLTAKSLSKPPNKETVAVTIKASSAAQAVLPVTLVSRTKNQVNMVGIFSVLGVSGAGEAPLPGAQISLVGATSGTVTADATGKLSALPLLHAASFNTLRVHKGAAFLESYIALVAPAVDQPGQTGTYRLYETKLLPATLCGVVPRIAGLGSVLIAAPPKGGGQGWTYQVTGPGALVRYLDSAWSPDCTLDSSGASGRAVAINLSPGARWVLARKGAAVHARLVQVPAGAAAAIVSFDN